MCGPTGTLVTGSSGRGWSPVHTADTNFCMLAPSGRAVDSPLSWLHGAVMACATPAERHGWLSPVECPPGVWGQAPWFMGHDLPWQSVEVLAPDSISRQPQEETTSNTESDAEHSGRFGGDGNELQEDPPTKLSVEMVPGNVWSFATKPDGCRIVQQAFDEARNNGEREALAAELHGHVWAALRCPSANFVLQKCIATLHHHSLQFVLDELMLQGCSAAVYAAKHRYGCRIVLRLLEHCTASQVAPLSEALLESLEALCAHAYGNFVVQHLIDFGSREQTRRCFSLLAKRALDLGLNGHSCAVLNKAFSCGTSDDATILSRAILSHEDLVVRMSCCRHGSAAVIHMLETLPAPERGHVCRQLSGKDKKLIASRYGRMVLPVLQAALQKM
uniref:PUM-HD domain-containing protein n=1 Tax=Noctiluca scintillans TaxID=2966 RepID=A0A7S1F1W1_NOCSC|mmetsp:Transcript_25514/g.66764  ORF Transcript_25514/g.66764 Transcript_25514/m.66764 type:complete len:389 (+) Transcript_25514:47-1213(+)